MALKILPAVVVATALLAAVALPVAQQASPSVSSADLLDALKDPTRWLMFAGDYSGRRHSPLTQITPENVQELTHRWTFQTETLGRFETTPVVHDGVLYVTGPNNVAWAIDARTGRQFWRYRRELPGDLKACCGPVNRGFAMLGTRLFMVTLDAHLVALDARTGTVLYDVEIVDYQQGYAATLAPLVVKNKVIVGVAGGDYGVRGFLDAYDTDSGERLWRFYTVPAEGEPGSETWAGDSSKRGGASIWVTGSYDPELNLLYYGTGNPGPDFHGDSRLGDNLYSNTLLAIDADTGQRRWHYQFTPNDTHDWDSTHVPVLADLRIGGRLRRVVMVANRNGFFYTLDRTNGEVLAAKPFVHTTWAKEIGRDGRPVLLPGNRPNETGSMTCPDLTGGTNFYAPSYDPARGLFFVNARETCALFFAWEPEFHQGQLFLGGASQRAHGPEGTYGALRAIDPTTAERKWEFRYPAPGTAGVLSTASGLVFTGDNAGNVLALDSRNGRLLWHAQLGSNLHGTSPVTYLLDGRQYVLIPSGATLVAYSLPERAR